MGKRHTTCCLISHENPRSKSRGRLRTERRARGTARGSLEISHVTRTYDTIRRVSTTLWACARARRRYTACTGARAVRCRVCPCGAGSGKRSSCELVTVVESEKDQSLTSLSCIRTKGMMQVNLPRELAKGRAV